MNNFRKIEKFEFNQYWYSDATITAIITEIVSLKPIRVAFLSTPSLFAALVAHGIPCDVFDLDPDVSAGIADSRNRYIRYDYSNPIMSHDFDNMYDVVVIDPPFISKEVLERYAVTTAQIKMHAARIIVSSVIENDSILCKCFGPIRPVPFKPSIPNLIYQYSLFVNYEIAIDSPLGVMNPAVL